MQRFSDKVVLVTGAGSGIGKACAIRIAGEGGRVFCVDLNEDALSVTVDEIEQGGGVAASHCCDISDKTQVSDCVAACIDLFGTLFALVNMAGLLRFDASEELATDDWQKVVDVNLTGTLLLCRAALPHLEASGGSIVNASSTSAHAGLPYGAAYSASKGGVLAMTRSLAVEYAKRGVRANSVSPGNIETDMTSKVAFPESTDFDLLLSRMASLLPAAAPEAVAGVVAMLASEDGVHITGEDIRVDGGTLS